MTRDCWKDFAVSGRVSDYLKYREQECRRGAGAVPAAWIGGVVHGTDSCADRDGTVSDACR